MRSHHASALLPLAFAVLLTSVLAGRAAFAQQPVTLNKTPPTIDLLADDSLDAWHVSGCRVSVDDGVLRLEEGDGFARIAWPLRDFELAFEWRPLGDAGYDSGIYFRAPEPEGSPWPARHQINLLQGHEGGLLGYPEAKVPEGLVRPRDWNAMRLKVSGRRAELTINDRPAWTIDDLPIETGFVGIQSEVPGGGRFEFRKLTLVELDAEPLLHDDLTGWTVVGDVGETTWQVRDGVLRSAGGNSWLRHETPIDDVELRLEYRVPPHGNSGVYLRVPEDGAHHGPGSGVEIQILDDAHPDYVDLAPYQYSAGLYDFAGSEPRVSRPAGSWNVLEIAAVGGRYRIRHNGLTVVDVDDANLPELAQRNRSGFWGLQGHGEQVEFRRVRRVLP